MKRQIRIKVGTVTGLVDLFDTKTAEAIWQTLPFSSKAKTWGDEIYFSIPLKRELEAGQEVVNLGDLGYWPIGSAFCIFFGLTSVSSQDEFRPASAVDVFGHLIDDPKVFKQVEEGGEVVIEKV